MTTLAIMSGATPSPCHSLANCLEQVQPGQTVIADTFTALGSTLGECIDTMLLIKGKGGFVHVPGVMDTSTAGGALAVDLLSAVKIATVDQH